ncbi:YeeE/YedE thiosulfate transporter family protein [Desulfonatronovibrio hydrogenovorans]|uniref:YeeE/YedE thiosulfate transporter family protein n=1 Tax=Desulfonatronovibrio hydrogenovorans TaxID=53245 RepID=UPI00048E03FC|nr:YeeE/YedE thiosulfate transporter family protein [Desulfonatronovibrio hydrogenovorans]
MAGTFWQSIKEETQRSYSSIFESSWPGWLAGIFLAILALMIFMWHSPWGITAGFRNWGDWIIFGLGLSTERPVPPWLSTTSVTNLGLLAGAFASALMARQFKIRSAPAYEYLKGAVGGAFMGIGAALAAGCNIGGFYNAIGMFSMGGYAMMIGLGIGAYIGLRFLIWELEKFPQQAAGPPKIKKPQAKPMINWGQVSPFAGGAVLLMVVAAFYLYSAQGHTQLGGLFFFGTLIGITMHRSRMCFVRAFREPFMTGDAEMIRVIAMSLMIYGMGSAVIKWSYLQPEMMGVYHPFWLGSLTGGIIFGFGMLLAGGCGTGSLWRAGEGHTKLMLTLVFFSIFNSLGYRVVHHTGLTEKIGSGIFMPEVFGWELALPLYMLFLLAWVFWAVWNEKTEKFVVF